MNDEVWHPILEKEWKFKEMSIFDALSMAPQSMVVMSIAERATQANGERNRQLQC
jgi:hypothetical protein